MAKRLIELPDVRAEVERQSHPPARFTDDERRRLRLCFGPRSPAKSVDHFIDLAESCYFWWRSHKQTVKWADFREYWQSIAKQAKAVHDAITPLTRMVKLECEDGLKIGVPVPVGTDFVEMAERLRDEAMTDYLETDENPPWNYPGGLSEHLDELRGLLERTIGYANFAAANAPVSSSRNDSPDYRGKEKLRLLLADSYRRAFHKDPPERGGFAYFLDLFIALEKK